jgi:hypothetical protein
MKASRQQKNIRKPRFAACGNAARLLTISVRAAGRAPVSKSVSTVHLSAGCFFLTQNRHPPPKTKLI